MEKLYRTTKSGTNWKAMYRCDCGNEFESRESHVNSGATKSCGCLNSRLASERLKTHGLKGSQEHNSWARMKARCNNPNNIRYHRYGGRGITYDPKWETFEGFLEDMGFSPKDGFRYSIDRVDNNGNYCKESCQWLTVSDNARKGGQDEWIAERPKP